MTNPNNHITRILTNPYYCLARVHEEFVAPHDPLISEERFIEAGATLIAEIGAREYLKELLENLKGNYVSGVN